MGSLGFAFYAHFLMSLERTVKADHGLGLGAGVISVCRGETEV